MTKLYYSDVNGKNHQTRITDNERMELSKNQIKRIEELTGKNFWNATLWDRDDNFYSIAGVISENFYIAQECEERSIR